MKNKTTITDFEGIEKQIEVDDKAEYMQWMKDFGADIMYPEETYKELKQ